MIDIKTIALNLNVTRQTIYNHVKKTKEGIYRKDFFKIRAIPKLFY